MPYFGEPVGQVKIQETSKNVPRYYTLNRSVRDLLINSKEYKMELSKNADACLLTTRMRDRLTWVLFSRAFINAIADYWSEIKTCQTGLLCKSIFFGFFCRRFEVLSLKHLLYKQRWNKKIIVRLMMVFRLRKIKRTASRAICDWKHWFSHKFKEFQRVSRRQRTWNLIFAGLY